MTWIYGIDVRCDKCGAKAGESCTSSGSKKIVSIHSVREQRRRREQHEEDLRAREIERNRTTCLYVGATGVRCSDSKLEVVTDVEAVTNGPVVTDVKPQKLLLPFCLYHLNEKLMSFVPSTHQIERSKQD